MSLFYLMQHLHSPLLMLKSNNNNNNKNDDENSSREISRGKVIFQVCY